MKEVFEKKVLGRGVTYMYSRGSRSTRYTYDPPAAGCVQVRRVYELSKEEKRSSKEKEELSWKVILIRDQYYVHIDL